MQGRNDFERSDIRYQISDIRYQMSDFRLRISSINVIHTNKSDDLRQVYKQTEIENNTF